MVSQPPRRPNARPRPASDAPPPATSARPPLVLVASDQEWAARSLESILAPAGYAVLRARGGREALRLALGANPDAIVIEAHMPDLNALAICRALRADPHVRDSTPIIVTSTGQIGRTERLAFLRAGAWDCCSAPIDSEHLLARLQTYVRAKQAHDRLREETLIDQRTGLYSLDGLKRRLREIASDTRRRGGALSCIVLGPDMQVGDTAAGEPAETEPVMDRLADVLRGLARESDVIGRLGPTELAIIAPGAAQEGAQRIIDRLRSALADAPPAGTSDRQPALRAGVCASADFAGERLDPMEFLLRATSALRDVRTSGGTTVASSLRNSETPP
jgi:diguanylate cyclase (GGDEF)-like protein